MLVPTRPVHGPCLALQLQEAGDKRARVVEWTVGKIEAVRAFLVLDLRAPPQLQVRGRAVVVGRATVELLRVVATGAEGLVVKATRRIEDYPVGVLMRDAGLE